MLQVKRKFSSFFKSLVIELDKELYGPDNHLVEWHRTLTTQETDGFQVKRPGYKNVRCTILLLLDYQPLQFKLDQRLARLLGVHTQARPVIVNALWQYIKTHRLQDAHEREWVLCDKYLEQIFGVPRLKLAEVPARLSALLHAPDPIVINHVIAVEPPHDAKQTACYDIDVEVDDSLKQQMNAFLLSTANQQEIQGLDAKIHETVSARAPPLPFLSPSFPSLTTFAPPQVDTINQLKTNREFFLSFSKDPQQFIHKWLVSQSRDLKVRSAAAAGRRVPVRVSDGLTVRAAVADDGRGRRRRRQRRGGAAQRLLRAGVGGRGRGTLPARPPGRAPPRPGAGAAPAPPRAPHAPLAPPAPPPLVRLFLNKSLFSPRSFL